MADMRTWNPRVLANWIALGFSLAVLCVQLSTADAIDVVVFSIAFLPWIVGPILMAVLFVRRASTRSAAWSFLTIEVCAAGSTIALWAYLMIHNDAQNGIAMMLFPVVQFVGVLIASLLVVALFAVLKRRSFTK